MPDSATSLTDRRRSDTTRTLIRLARRFTAEFGLSGFTIEQLCSEAAVSRRTFFNYFANKEDAVLGLPLERSDADAVAHFLTRSEARAGEISGTLLIDLAALNEVRWRAMDVAPDTIADLGAAVEREPRLVARMLAHAIAEEQFDARLIEQRENLLPGDLRARVAASVLGAIARATGAEFFQPGNTDSFADIFDRHITAAGELFATQTTLIGPR